MDRTIRLRRESKNTYLSKNVRERKKLDSFAFIPTSDSHPKGKVVEWERIKDELLLLETTVGRTVSLLQVVPDRAESELEASVDKLFDEGGSGNQTEQGDSAGGGKRKTVVVDAGESSHPPKRLREDHRTPSGASVGGKSMFAVQRFLDGAVLNAKVRGRVIPTLPFVTSSISTTPEHKGGDHTDSVAEPNLQTVSAPQRFVISLDYSHHSGANIAEAEVDSLVRSSVLVMATVTTITSTVDLASIAKEKPVKPSSLFTGSSLAGGTDPATGGFTDLTGSDFLVGGIRTVINPESDLQKTYVPQWSVTNGSRLDDGRVCREMVNDFAPPKFFVSIREMEHDQLFTEFNVAAARQMSLSAETVEKSLRDEVNALKERNTILEKERNALDVKATDLEASAMDKEHELTNLNVQLTFVKSQNENLVNQVHELEVSSAGLQEKLSSYENLT
ncbi:hypothetical protein Tco_1115908 [Tanacetum coccineum]